MNVINILNLYTIRNKKYKNCMSCFIVLFQLGIKNIVEVVHIFSLHTMRRQNEKKYIPIFIMFFFIFNLIQ